MKQMMMTAFFMTCFTLLAHAATVNSAAIKKQTSILGKLALGGVSITKVKPGSAKEMIRAFAEKQGFSGEDFEFQDNVSVIQSSDESTFGTATMGAALGLVEETTDYMNEHDETYKPAKITAMKKAIRDLVGTGVVFGFNPHGNSVCGMNFSSLLVLDTKSGIIYEIDFYGTMEC